MSLALGTVQSWSDSEKLFHNWFCAPHVETMISHLLAVKQGYEEPMAQFLERFRQAKTRCTIQIPEQQKTAMAEYSEEQDVLAAELLKGKTYSCSALRPTKGKEIGGDQYTFDVPKVEQIFDHLLKDKQIKLRDGQRVPSLEELKGKVYCKWHGSYTHATASCTYIRNTIQKALDEGRLKLTEKSMQVDANPFPAPSINTMSTGSPKDNTKGSNRFGSRFMNDSDLEYDKGVQSLIC
ncbi:uncharacterized protein LOC127245690 [Andrographis paniculata]|uniref:uncharacterized protein LOC127245690 n=1 Tax=Andrographis paniculata TaxID=175694 RepID=UPI0021E7A866|nr:uncharacterized protein LOC127245690 [Andrographis paniculata]